MDGMETDRFSIGFKCDTFVSGFSAQTYLSEEQTFSEVELDQLVGCRLLLNQYMGTKE